MNIDRLILEEYTKIQETAADELRQSLPSGYKEKNSEIDSGGEMSIYAVKLFIEFFKFLKKENPDIKLKISGGHDKFHKNYISRHNTGEALDFVVTSGDKQDVSDSLKKFKDLNSDFKYVDEYENPTPHATAPHFHIAYVGPNALGAKKAKDVTSIMSNNNSTEVTPDVPADSDEWGAIDYFQTVLDFAGFIPGWGILIDIINAAIYFAREKYVDGFLSLIAVIPVAGSFVASGMKVAFKAIGLGKVSRALRKAMKGAPGDMQKLWTTMLKDGNLDAATLREFAKHGDTIAEMLRSSARKLKKLDKAGIPMPDAVYKQMDDIADLIKNVTPKPAQLSAIGKIAKGTGKAVKTVAKGVGTVTKKIVALPIRIAVSPITIPIGMAKASVRALTGKLGSGSTSLIKRFVGKSGDDIADMERAVRILFKKKLAANPLLLANMIKTNGKRIGTSKYFKNLDPNAAAMLKDLHKQPVKDIEGTLLMLLKRDPKTANWTNFSAADYKNLVKETSDMGAATGNPYYNTFIKDEAIKWAAGKSPGLKFAGAWDSKPWYDWPNTKGLKTLDVLSNEIQDAGEKLGLEDTDDPQGVILQSLVLALRYAGALSDENVETIKDFSKTYIKPLYSMLKQEITQYATLENAKEGAKQFKKYTYHQVPGLDENGKEVDSASATASQKWNYLSTHASEFTAETWKAITFMWDLIMSDF